MVKFANKDKEIIMEIRIIWFISLIVLMINGCGSDSSSGDSSSFDASNNAPTINNLSTSNSQTVKSIVKEENGEYKIYVNENQRTAFKIEATDSNKVTYALSGGDWKLFYVDKYKGEFFFKEPTDYETKAIYIFNIVVDDGLGNITSKKATIYVDDIKNEQHVNAINSDISLLNNDENKYFITTWKTDNQIMIPTLGDGYNYSIDWGDGTSSKQVSKNITHIYPSPGIYTVKIIGEFPRIYFYTDELKHQNSDDSVPSNNLKILSIEQWGNMKWSSMNHAFSFCSNLKVNAIDTPNLSNVTDMSFMFWGAKFFNQDIGEWDVSNITSTPPIN